MLNSLRVPSFLIRNFQHFGRSHTIKRHFAQYQFKVTKPIYYPDRQSEMRRYQESMQSQIMLEKQAKRHLPKDYYYKILGVNRHATMQQIKSAYYSMAKRFHPDVTQSEQKLKHFQEVSNAYTILTDESKRLEYDQMGIVRDEQAFLEQSGAPIIPKNLDKEHMDQKPLSKEELMKMTSTDPNLELTFVESATGVKKSVDLRYLKKCTTCNGKSQLLANRPTNTELCPTCKGAGQIKKKTSTYTSVVKCEQCKGKRYINRSHCDTCQNRGYLMETVKVVVPVPAGANAKDVITIENPNTKQRVNFHLQVKESDYFRRSGNDIHTEKYVTISEAILGGVFKIRGLYEDFDLKVEAGTESHTMLTVRNKGIRSNRGVGSHIITLKIRVPRQLSMKQRQLVLALSKTEDPVFERPI